MVVFPKKDVYCNCCGNNEYKIIARLRNACIARCTECSLIFVIREDVVSIGRDYFHPYDLDKYTSYYQEFRNNFFKKHLRIIEQLVHKGAILDVGCSFGWFLKLARDFGWQPFGIEESEEVAKIASQTGGLNIMTGDIKLINRLNTYFQVITLWNVLEHIADPLDTLKSSYNKLSPEGLLVISVPNVNGLFSRIAFWSYKASLGRFKFPLEQLYQANNPHMHLFHFSEDTLALILKRCNFKVIKVVRQQAIDSKKIRDRIDMDQNLKFKSVFLKSLLIGLTKFISYLSEIISLQDEIVLYAKKSSSEF